MNRCTLWGKHPIRPQYEALEREGLLILEIDLSQSAARIAELYLSRLHAPQHVKSDIHCDETVTSMLASCQLAVKIQYRYIKQFPTTPRAHAR